MKKARIAALAVISACAGIVMLQHAATPSGGVAVGIPPTSTSVLPTPVASIPAVPLAASPTTTATIPSAAVLLAQALGRSAARGSVSEKGAFRSTNDDVFDAFTFSARLSWQTQGFHDSHTFAKPAYLNKDLGYATSVTRLAAGPWLAQRVHGAWSCTHQTALKNSPLWQPPSFPLLSLRLVAAATVGSHRAWNIRGSYVHKLSGQVGRYQVNVFVDQQAAVFLKAVETGRVTAKSGKYALVNGKVTYSDYGKHVPVTLPGACKS
jgi:hypothetical protein